MTVKRTIQLSEERDAFARSLVDSGRYSSVDDVFREGLDLLRKEVAGENATMEAFRATIERRSKGPTISAIEMEKRISAIIARKRQVTSFAAKRHQLRCPTHPGELLRQDILPAIGKSKTEIADLIGISRRHLSQILKEERAVSAAVAVRFGKMFGNEPLMWMRMQAAYDVWHAAREINVSSIPMLRGG